MQVLIRPLEEQDAYTSVKWRNDPEVFKYTGNTYDHEITIESELNWIRNVISKSSEYRCAIIADGVYVGNIYLTDIHEAEGHYHIFIGNKEYWGKGVAKEASIQILNYAMERRSLKKIFLSVHKDNRSAINLYESLGFKLVNCDGEKMDMILNLE